MSRIVLRRVDFLESNIYLNKGGKYKYVFLGTVSSGTSLKQMF